MELTANFATRTVKVRQLGSNACCIEDSDLAKGSVDSLYEGKTLYVLNPKEYPHKIVFKISRDKDKKKTEKSRRSETLKRRAESDDSDDGKHKRAKRDEDTVDSGDSDDSERAAIVEEQLREMRAHFKKHSARKDSSSEEETSPQAKPKARKPIEALGEPADENIWKELGKLLVFTKKGVRASSKVCFRILCDCVSK